MKDGGAISAIPAEPLNERRSAIAIDQQNFIPSMINYLAQKISSTASATYRPRFGIGITEWRVMALLAAEPWIAPFRICEATGLDKAAVSRSLRDLAAKSLVEIRGGLANQRRVPVALTAKGLALHDQVIAVARKREASLLEGFSAEERAELQLYLRRLVRQIEEFTPDDF